MADRLGCEIALALCRFLIDEVICSMRLLLPYHFGPTPVSQRGQGVVTRSSHWATGYALRARRSAKIGSKGVFIVTRL
jgi:hypothetical protein